MLLDTLGWIYCFGMIVTLLMQIRAFMINSYETLWYAIHYVLIATLGFQILKGILALFIGDWFTVFTSVFCVFLGVYLYHIYKYRQLPKLAQYKKVTAKEKADAQAAKIMEELNKTYKVVDDQR